MIAPQDAANELRCLRNKYGLRIASDRKFCASIVLDYFMSRYPIEAQLLAEAVACGVTEEISKLKRNCDAQQYLQKIQDEFAKNAKTDRATAAWVVTVWGMAFDIVDVPLPDTLPFPTGAPLAPPIPPAPPFGGTPKGSTAKRGCLKKIVITALVGFLIVLFHNGGHLECPKTSSNKPTTTILKPDEPEIDATPFDLSSVTIRILKDSIMFNGKIVKEKELDSLLRQVVEKNFKRPIVILWDEDASESRYNNVVQVCKKSGLRNLIVNRSSTQ